MPAKPIWKDYAVDFGTYAYADFRVVEKINSTTVYQGRAYRRPGQTHLYVKVNDICADWLEHVLPTLQQADLTPTNLPVEFDVDDLTRGYNVDTVRFYGDWSYDPAFDYTTMGLAHPINGRIDGRQWIPVTVIDANDVTMEITYNDGTVQTVTIPLAISADFNADYNADFALSLMTAGSGTAFFDLSQWSDVNHIVLNGLARYDVVTECARYALYYVNAYGGWDTFLIEANDATADALTRHTMAVEYDNGSTQARGVRDYAIELQRGITLHTGWLTDDQSLRMHHLLNSPDVYIWDFSAGTMTPVVLTNPVTEYKTYKNTGRRMVDYTVTLTIAHQMERR